MLDLSVAVLKSRWLTSYADRISQSEYEKLVDAQIAQLLKEVLPSDAKTSLFLKEILEVKEAGANV